MYVNIMEEFQYLGILVVSNVHNFFDILPYKVGPN